MKVEFPRLNPLVEIIVALILFAVLMVAVDLGIANWADRVVLARNADFEQQLDGVQLDFENGDGHSCNQRFVLMLYRYQTCFVYEKGFEVTRIVRPLELRGKGYFRYIYQAPSSILLGQNKKDAYRFGERRSGRVLMVLNSDGSIMDVFEGNN